MREDERKFVESVLSFPHTVTEDNLIAIIRRQEKVIEKAKEQRDLVRREYAFAKGYEPEMFKIEVWNKELDAIE